MQRKKGDGSFNKLSNGTIEYTVSVGYDVYGKRQRKKFYGKTEAECRKKYKEFIKGGEKETNKTKEYILSDWMDVWLKTYKQKNVQSSTYDEYVYLARHVKRHKVSGIKLSNIKPIHITEFFADMSDYSHSIRKRLRFLMNGAFECALDNDYISKNPLKRAEIAKKPTGEKEAFTEDEVRTIINFAKSDKLFGLPIYIMLNTGIRSGEMRALITDKIDLKTGVVTIDKAVKRTGELGPPKNGKTRYIPIKPEVVRFLSAKIVENTKYLIGDIHYVTASSFRSSYLHFFNRLNRLLKDRGEEPIGLKSPHSLRHTYGTLCQKNGMPLAMVSELLGHSSTDVTDKYTHLNDVGILTEAVKKYVLFG